MWVKEYLVGEKNEDNGGDIMCFLVLVERCGGRRAEKFFFGPAL